jgi:adenosylmethionine-8-amino-7-oxononanoate aminotransferase
VVVNSAQQPVPAASAVFHRRPGETYPVFVRGDGCELWDDRGKRYLDLSSGMAWAASLGQGRKDIAEVLSRQAGTLTYLHNAWASTDRQEEYATRLTAKAPVGMTRVMFTSGGSESNELAIRITRQYQLSVGQPARWKIISLQHSYHGASVGALSLTGSISVNEMMATDYDPYLIRFPRVPAPITYRGPFAHLSPDQAAQAAAQAVEDGIRAADPSTVAAFIVEPIMGNGAMTVLPDGYLPLVREICDRYGLLLIVDEVMTGAGRTGTFLRTEALGVVPDLVILAKAISGGYAPLGAVLLHERVSDAIVRAGRRLDHVHTHSGHPVSCAVGLAVLDILEREGLVDAARERGVFLRAELDRQLGDHPAIGEVRGVGLANAVEYVADRATRRAFPAASGVAVSIWEGMLERGYLLPTRRYQDSDVIGDYSLIAPAFVISEGQLREGVAALKDTIDSVSARW